MRPKQAMTMDEAKAAYAVKIQRSYESTIQLAWKNRNEKLENEPKRIASIVKLIEIGIMPESAGLKYIAEGYCFTWEWAEDGIIDAKFLPALHAAFGQCKLNDDYKTIYSAERAEVKVRLDLGNDYDGPNMYVIRKLDGTEKCKIVTETVVNIQTSLVCQRPNDK